MATFLSGVNDLLRELSLTVTPTDVTNQTGELDRLIKWYRDAYIDIQNRNGGEWRWLRHPFTFDTVADDDEYAYTDVTDVSASAVISRFNKWHLASPINTPKAYLTSGGIGSQYRLTFIDWDDFSSIYKIGSNPSAAPQFITIDPQDNIVLGPPPSGVYTVTGEYYRAPQILAANADTPEMPSQFHRLIVFAAMKQYALSNVAVEFDSSANYNYNRLMTQLDNNQGPTIKFGGALC